MENNCILKVNNLKKYYGSGETLVKALTIYLWKLIMESL